MKKLNKKFLFGTAMAISSVALFSACTQEQDLDESLTSAESSVFEETTSSDTESSVDVIYESESVESSVLNIDDDYYETSSEYEKEPMQVLYGPEKIVIPTPETTPETTIPTQNR